MKTPDFLESELVLHTDGSVYHLRLLPEHIADTVLLVGDQGRVSRISRFFDRIELKISNREFVTHTGSFRGKRFTAISTGIGTDNIDIVMNELDAAVNIDLQSRTARGKKRSLDIIRMGTSGALHEDIPVDSLVLSSYGLGFDGLIYYYQYEFSEDENRLANAIKEHLNWDSRLASPYLISADEQLKQSLEPEMITGITATATGFYGPQGRQLNLPLSREDINQSLASFIYQGQRITNFEMETSALYALGKALGHRCCTCCTIIANRWAKSYSGDYQMSVDHMIETVLNRLVDQAP